MGLGDSRGISSPHHIRHGEDTVLLPHDPSSERMAVGGSHMLSSHPKFPPPQTSTGTHQALTALPASWQRLQRWPKECSTAGRVQDGQTG